MYRMIKPNKKPIRPIYCGISGKYNNQKGKYDFTVDFEKNTEEDVIQFLEPYRSRIQNHAYWFGYKFNGKLDRRYRDEFIKYLKGVQLTPPLTEENEFDDIEYSKEFLSEFDLSNMIANSMQKIHIGSYNIDTVVYPVSATNNLVKCIVRCIGRCLGKCNILDYVEIQKSDPKNILIDIDTCLKHSKSGSIDLPYYVDRQYLEELQQNIHKSSSFSLRHDVHPQILREYVSNFLEISQVSGSIEDSENVLIVDDFKTSGTTIIEMINIIEKYNPDCNIYIFTLIGNNR